MTHLPPLSPTLPPLVTPVRGAGGGVATLCQQMRPRMKPRSDPVPGGLGPRRVLAALAIPCQTTSRRPDMGKITRRTAATDA